MRGAGSIPLIAGAGGLARTTMEAGSLQSPQTPSLFAVLTRQNSLPEGSVSCGISTWVSAFSPSVNSSHSPSAVLYCNSYALCGVPVAGVVPYTTADIDDEDSLTERFSRDTARKLVDIAVIRLPKISNFTDFSPFERYENVSLRYVDHVGALGTPDMILLPGTKSTIADLRWLRERGLEAAILKEAAGGTLVFGVCGGYQMLGRSVSDPEGVEAAGLTELRGMGLLEMETVFHGEKVQRQTAGMFSGVEGMLAGLNELRYEGYEIHMGRSEAQMPALAGNGNVYGSYVHGIFDAPGIADEILKAICARRGVAFSALGTFDRAAYRERQYDLLADAVRAGLNMEFVYRVLRKEI